jgi:serine/threonine-protein kinase
MPSSLEGSFVGGRYSIVQYIASGGMAAVFRGWDHREERPVAVKVLRQLDSADEHAIARFQREAYAAAMLHHPHVVRVYDFFEDDGRYYLVMEHVDGVNLKQHLRRSGPLPASEAFAIAEQVCSALHAAHQQGFIHRDIKPQNILLEQGRFAKLTDFGIVYIAHGGTLTSRGMVMGTADYIAPEQARGEPVKPASDLYSVGVVLYELLTGCLPFSAPTPVAVAAQHATAPVIPPSRHVAALAPYGDAIVLRAMEKCPERRYRDALAMGLALRLGRQMLAPATAGARDEQAAGALDRAAPVAAGMAGAAETTEAASAASPKSTGADDAVAVDVGDHWGRLADAEDAGNTPAGATPRILIPDTGGDGLGWRAADSVEQGAVEPGLLSVGDAWLRALVVCIVTLLLVSGIIALEAWLRVHGAAHL